MKKITISIFIAICFLNIQSASTQNFNLNLSALLQNKLDSLVPLFSNTKGVSASVYCPGQGIWTGVNGLSYTGEPLTTNMEFGIASNSKLFVSVAMLILAESNVLTLDDSLHEWLPAYPNVNPDITIRQLLNHTSGVSDPIFVSPLFDSITNNPTQVFTPNEVLTYLGAPLFNPGTGYGYSNVNYILAGMVAESATGYHISEIIRDSILTPLQLNNTFYDIEEPEIGTIAHRWFNGVDYHDTSRIALNTAGGAAGSIFSTSADMANWYQALMSGQVINPSSLNEMTTFGVPGNYGLGIASTTFFGQPCWGHGGVTLGYKSRMIYDPCMKVTVCGISNSDPSAIDGITALLYQEVLDHLPTCGGNVNGSTVVCRGDQSITYAVPLITNATSYIWTLPFGVQGNSNTNTITVDYGMSAVSGDITVKGINLYGEGATSTLSITVNTVPTGVSFNGSILSADSLADSYQWIECNNGNQAIAGETNQVFTPTVNGSYAVIMDRGLCTDTSVCTVIANLGVYPLQNIDISVYPIPVSNVLYIESQGSHGPLNVEMLNSLGQIIYTGILLEKISISMGELAGGVYIIRFKNETTNQFKKILKY